MSNLHDKVLRDVLVCAYVLAPDLPDASAGKITVSPGRDGWDFSTNAAILVGRHLSESPQAVAGKISGMLVGAAA